MGTSDDRSGPGASPQASLRALSEFLTTNRAEIVARWRGAVRRALGEEAADLADPVPELLDRLAELEPGDGDGRLSATQVLEQGGVADEDATAAVTQLVLLRDQVVELWEDLPREGSAAMRLLNRALDAAVMGVVVRAAAAHLRMGRALDRLAEAARAAGAVETQIDSLLRIVLEEGVAVDGAVLLLRDGEGFRVLAAVGVDAASARGRAVLAGEGFPGVVLAANGPIMRRWAGDPLAPESGGSPSRAVHGVPLAPFGGGPPAGVAYVVSVTANDFPLDDRRLFRVAVDNATAALDARRLRDTGDDDALRARDRALATFAHDLRSPLGVVLMQAGIMLRSTERESQEKITHRGVAIQRAALRMERLLADYQAFQEARGGRLSFTSDTVQPSELARKAVEGLRTSATERRVVLEVELSPGLPALIGDGQRLQEALEHLLRAALSAVPDGGRIALRAQHDDGGIVFSVQDSAPALDPDALAETFDRSWMGERPSIARGGLGLAVAKAIVEAHGGRIWATSSTGEGNTFCCALPAARA
jgi:signal transduction histidine kinase